MADRARVLGDRPQDVDRVRRRRGSISPETAAVLDRYRAAMRAELGTLLEELERGGPGMVQTSIDGAGDKAIALELPARKERWDLAIRLGRELATGGIDPEPVDLGPQDPTVRISQRARAPRLSARERARLEA